MEKLTIENLKEVIVSQAVELDALNTRLAETEASKNFWYEAKLRESDTLEKLQGNYDGLEELYTQRGDHIKELEARLQHYEEQTGQNRGQVETVHLEIEEGQ